MVDIIGALYDMDGISKVVAEIEKIRDQKEKCEHDLHNLLSLYRALLRSEQRKYSLLWTSTR